MAIRVQCRSSITFPDDGPLRNSLVTPGGGGAFYSESPGEPGRGGGGRGGPGKLGHSTDLASTTTEEVTTTAQLTGGRVVDGGGAGGSPS